MWRSFSTTVLAKQASNGAVFNPHNMVAASAAVSSSTSKFVPSFISNSSSLDSVGTAKVFASYSPVDRIRLINDIHGNKAIQLASMQRTSGVLMHLIHRAQVDIPILFFDTELLHQETYDLRDEFIERFDLNITTVKAEISPQEQEATMGKDLWKTVAGQAKCCYTRKEKPLMDTLEKLSVQATISGMMQAQGGARKGMEGLSVDPRTGNIVYAPLFDWTNKMIHDYTQEHNIPVHALYSQNYKSIGCKPCTTPVKEGEDDRAGRWRHLREATGVSHAYCGMNATDTKLRVPETPKKGGYLSRKKKPVSSSSIAATSATTITALKEQSC